MFLITFERSGSRAKKLALVFFFCFKVRRRKKTHQIFSISISFFLRLRRKNNNKQAAVADGGSYYGAEGAASSSEAAAAASLDPEQGMQAMSEEFKRRGAEVYHLPGELPPPV